MKKVILALMLMVAGAMVVNAQITVNGVSNFTVDGIYYGFDIGNGEEDIDENGIIHNPFFVVHAGYGDCELLKNDSDEPIDLVVPARVEFEWEWYDVRSVSDIEKCHSLRSVVLEDGITEVYNCFNDCEKLESVDLGASVTLIRSNSFCNLPSLKSVNLSESLEEIGAQCFCRLPALEHIDFPESLGETGWSCFVDCGFKSLDFLYPIYCGAGNFFKLSELESINFFDGVGLMGSAFCDLPKLKCLHLPNEMHWISHLAFSRMESLEELYLPEDDFSLEASAFISLPKLKRIYCPLQTPPQIATYDDKLGWCYEFSLHYTDKAPIDKATCKLLVPPGCVEAYRNSRSWGCFANIEEYQFDGVDDVTVDGGDAADNPDAPCYDLYGRPVVDPASGIYIRNGKKVVVR